HQMKYLLSILSIAIVSISAVAQVIPEDRRVDWSVILDNMEITQPDMQVDVMDYGATGNGITDDRQAVINAISGLGGEHGYVYFPPGRYLIKGPIDLPDSCVLKGDGSGNTTLLFDLEGEATNCISISKAQAQDFTNITGGLNKGNNLITIEDPGLFTPGDYIEIRQENGSWDVVPISWADYSVGQLTRVSSIVDNNLLIESGLRIDYSAELNPEVRPVVPISNSGIQCLKIQRLDEPVEGSGANIYMYMAANCFVRGVESDTSVGAHVSVYSSLNILIDGNYFHHAFTFDGTGMRGYGVALSMHTSECLITNNIFRYLRHAMMIKTGSNGNIFSYNYSIEPHRSEPIPDASGDISFHGHYPFSNLWEGNIAQNIVIDHYWGPSGPYNTLFRNRAELWGIIMTNSTLKETDKQNFVGSETTSTELLHGLYVLTGTDQLEYGNNILGNILPPGTTDLPDNSYYLDEAPDFWGEFMEWPSVGIPVELGTGNIPARMRYESGQNYTICPDSIITDIDEPANTLSDLRIWPNPATSYLNISVPGSNSTISISLYNLLGKTEYSWIIKNNFNEPITIPLDHVRRGIYLVTFVDDKTTITRKLIVTK
ncbi:MAG: T9SS type A sorting domain-containing protein, partial [Bacteroidetes bacterium]|nr:T9SS type A sorting domain-containing protein [Bacteroidota bacterium]